MCSGPGKDSRICDRSLRREPVSGRELPFCSVPAWGGSADLRRRKTPTRPLGVLPRHVRSLSANSIFPDPNQFENLYICKVKIPLQKISEKHLISQIRCRLYGCKKEKKLVCKSTLLQTSFFFYLSGFFKLDGLGIEAGNRHVTGVCSLVVLELPAPLFPVYLTYPAGTYPASRCPRPCPWLKFATGFVSPHNRAPAG